MNRKSKILPTVIFIVLVVTSSSQAQWDSPVAITDSLSDNTNCITYKYAYPDTDILMIWQKSFDSTATAIYCRFLSPLSPPIPVLSQENVHFRNPQITAALDPGSMFYLFYETNQNGINEIYYLKYLASGEFSAPIPFVTQEENIEQMHASTGIITWIQNGNVLFSERKYSNDVGYFSEPACIDSNSCKEPISTDWLIAWIKTFDDSSQIRYSEYGFVHDLWSAPKSITLKDPCSNIKFSSGDMSFNFITGELEKNITNVFIADLYSDQLDEMDDYPNLNKSDPTMFLVPKVTKSSSFMYPNIFAIVLDTLGTEIYANYDESFGNLANISNNLFLDRNPCFFQAEHNSVFLIWESRVNDHWQLFMTKSYYTYGAVDQDGRQLQDFSLKQNYPNPFNAETQITYSINTPATIRLSIFNPLGQEIKVLFEGMRLIGNYKDSWNGTDQDGKTVSSGIYYVNLKSGRYKLGTKIILLK